jgi:hypothetical protein
LRLVIGQLEEFARRVSDGLRLSAGAIKTGHSWVH